ncbi:MAG TPA: DUF4097 family beta strand repeat-containing protein [Steroidobacteraceae bacterium]|nr:DUF4097 family beta strand repeat-containing protein [Steroidobacteraceae bacterium]
MNNTKHLSGLLRLSGLAAVVLLAGMTLPAWAATRAFNAQKPADPAGTVEVVNVAGSIEISGWDQATVDVSGSIGERVERVDVTSSANRTSIRVVLPSGNSWNGDSEAHLKIRVPQKSALEVSLVSSDLRIAGVSGNQHLQTVSGDIAGEASGDLQVNTVSGDVKMATRNSHSVQIKTVSGDVNVTGADGTIQVNTVSGDAMFTLGTVTRAHFESISGDISVAAAALAASGQLEATSVSGDLGVHFTALPDADIDVQTFSGDISNCFGPKAVEQQYGPGSRLNFRNGKGGGHVHIDTKSGDVQLCDNK